MFSIEIDDNERAAQLADLEKFHLSPTRFSFINAHKGLRNGKTHVLISSSGAGKTTLSRAILVDVARNHELVFFSSEENVQDTQQELARQEVQNDVLSKIHFVHEDMLPDKTSPEGLFKILAATCLNLDAKCLFFDNLTTSDFYENRPPAEQVSFFKRLRNIAKELNIPVFVIAHTQSKTRDDQQALIVPEDVLGSKTVARKTQFLYVYQRIVGKSSGTGLTTPMTGLVRVKKARGYEVDKIYGLQYDHKSKSYIGDYAMSNEQMRSVYEERFRL
jgi:KaiC/GvpD/RAD55 family RecA-like ATPase